LFHLADCYEQSGKVASAWAAFLEVASLAAAAGQTDRVNASEARAKKLEARLPRLTIVVPEASRLPDLRVVRDDVDVGGVQWGTPLPVDPGPHKVVASAPGRRPFTDTVALKEGGTASLPIPVLEVATEQPAPAAAPQSAPPPAGVGTPSPAMDSAIAATQADTSGGGPSPLVIGLGALGIVGLGAGTVLGFMTKSKFDESKEHCNPNNENLCTQEGVDLRDNAFTLGNISTVGFIVGGVALAGAAVLWIADSGSNEKNAATNGFVRAGIAPNPGRPTFVMEGRF
jgi:serine/threonine-protein kinase